MRLTDPTTRFVEGTVDVRLLVAVAVALGIGFTGGILLAPLSSPSVNGDKTGALTAADPPAQTPTPGKASVPEATPPVADQSAVEPPVCGAPTPLPVPDCPPPRVCPDCPAPRCPTTQVVCAPHEKIIGSLRQNLDTSQRDLDACRNEGPLGRYKGTTARDRRILAAQDENLLLEFPSWGEELSLPPERIEKFALQDDQVIALEELYREFRNKTHEDLRRLYADLVGDPEAGQDSTINALIHNIMALSPREDCQERILVLLTSLSQGGPLPALSPDSAACEQAILLLYGGVDALDDKVLEALGKEAAGALWSGTSSFTYSTSQTPEKSP